MPTEATPDQPSVFSDIIIAALFSQFGDELTGCALQGGRGSTFTRLRVSAREATAELTDSGNDKVGQSLVGKGSDEFVQLRWR